MLQPGGALMKRAQCGEGYIAAKGRELALTLERDQTRDVDDLAEAAGVTGGSSLGHRLASHTATGLEHVLAYEASARPRVSQHPLIFSHRKDNGWREWSDFQWFRRTWTGGKTSRRALLGLTSITRDGEHRVQVHLEDLVPVLVGEVLDGVAPLDTA
jgi:hypothetical protein